MKLLPIPVVAALLAAPLAAQATILPYLPADTMVAISAPDIAASLAKFEKMPLARMWAEEDVQTFLADVKEMVGKQIAQGMAQAKEMHAQGALPVDPEQLKDLRVQGITFALTTLGLKMGDFGPDAAVGLVLHLDFGASAPTWKKLIETGLAMMEQQGAGEFTKQESKVGDVQMLSYTKNSARASSMGLNLAMLPNGIVVGTLADEVRQIVESMNAKAPKLAATPLYQAATKRLANAGAEVELFVRPDPFFDFVVSALRLGAEQGEMRGVDVDGVDRAITALGLRDLGAFDLQSSYVDGKGVDRMFWAHGKPGATTATKTIDTSFLKWVPKDAVSFSSSTVNMMALHDRLMKGLEAYDPEFAKKALAHLAEMEKQLGFSVKDDLFGSLGDHMITWSMPMGTISAAPEVAFLLAVKDETKIVNALKGLTKLSRGAIELEEGEKRGFKSYQLRFNSDPTAGMGGMNLMQMFQPSFAFKNGYLVGAFNSGDVKRACQRMDREDDPKGDIRSNKEFAAVAGQIPQGIESLSFTDWKAQFESYYQIGTSVLAFVPMGDEVPIDTSLLPDSATLTKHLFASLAWSKSDAEGTEMTSIGPFGAELYLLGVSLGIAGGVGSVMLPNMVR